MKTKYVAFDCETTGLEPDDSELLTVYFKFLDQNLETVDELELACKPHQSYYKVLPEAMAVNKIDLNKHNKIAIPYFNAGELLKSKLESQFSKEELDLLLDGKNFNLRFEPIGHNYHFDEAYCKKSYYQVGKIILVVEVLIQ